MWGSPSSIGNKILELYPQDALPEDQIFYVSRSAAVDMLQQTQEANQLLRQTVQVLASQMAELRSALGFDQPAPRDLTDAQAKKAIRAYFRENDGKGVYPDDIADALNLHLMQVVRICEELENAGKIARQD